MELTVRNSVTLNADRDKVWDALTNPQVTKKYMYNCEVTSDWKVGSPVLWKMDVDGRETVVVQGQVLSIEPKKHLAYTVFDPAMGIEDVPENYLTVSYELEERDGQTVLSVSQGDYSRVAEGEKRYQDTLGSWDYALGGLKKAVEE
jgi:uncharacterized protein YndB with AHSA1/START domain